MAITRVGQQEGAAVRLAPRTERPLPVPSLGPPRVVLPGAAQAASGSRGEVIAPKRGPLAHPPGGEVATVAQRASLGPAAGVARLAVRAPGVSTNRQVPTRKRTAAKPQ